MDRLEAMPFAVRCAEDATVWERERRGQYAAVASL